MSLHPRSGALRLAAIHAEPRDDAEQVTQALPGEPLDVDHEQGEWAHVRTAYGYPGWVRVDALGPTPPGDDWLSPREGDPVEEARAFLGAPYLWGGLTARGIDCSGLVHMAYRRLGRLVPRDADQQEAAGRPVPDDELRCGDLVTYGDAKTDHIAFWLGDGRILHATGRKDANAVVEEPEPDELRARRRRLIRL
jgi:gamma-D-glutamyl-L-lysine dipeptidyl-peptidase